jgi:Spy/CpxP family protein refolding chaperone
MEINMQRTLLIMIGAFFLTLAAGGVLGRIVSPARPGPIATDGGWLAQQLQLTADQRTQVRTIWDQTHAMMDAQIAQHRTSEKEFRLAVQGLLTDQQKIRYQTIEENFDKQEKSADAALDAAIDASIQKTKMILTPPQRDKYEQLLAKFPGHAPADTNVSRP